MPRYTVYKRVPEDLEACCEKCDLREKCEYIDRNRVKQGFISDCTHGGNWKKIKTYSSWRYIPKKYIKEV